MGFHNPVIVRKQSNYQENLIKILCSQSTNLVCFTWSEVGEHLVISALLIQMLHIRNLIQPTFLRSLEVDWNCEIPLQLISFPLLFWAKISLNWKYNFCAYIQLKFLVILAKSDTKHQNYYCVCEWVNVIYNNN